LEAVKIAVSRLRVCNCISFWVVCQADDF